MSTHDNRKPLLRILGFAGIAGAGIAIAVAYQQGQAAHERLIGQAYIQGLTDRNTFDNANHDWQSGWSWQMRQTTLTGCAEITRIGQPGSSDVSSGCIAAYNVKRNLKQNPDEEIPYTFGLIRDGFASR